MPVATPPSGGVFRLSSMAYRRIFMFEMRIGATCPTKGPTGKLAAVRGGHFRQRRPADPN